MQMVFYTLLRKAGGDGQETQQHTYPTHRTPGVRHPATLSNFATVHPVVLPLAALVATTTVFSVVVPAAVVTALAAPLAVSEPGHMDGPGTTYMVVVMAAAASMLKLMPGSLAL